MPKPHPGVWKQLHDQGSAAGICPMSEMGMQNRNVTSLVSFRGREVNQDSLENQERPG